MVVSFSWRNIFRRWQTILKLVFIVFIIIYVLPKICLVLWDIYHPIPKLQQQKLFETPLRVLRIYIPVKCSLQNK